MAAGQTAGAPPGTAGGVCRHPVRVRGRDGWTVRGRGTRDGHLPSAAPWGGPDMPARPPACSSNSITWGGVPSLASHEVEGLGGRRGGQRGQDEGRVGVEMESKNIEESKRRTGNKRAPPPPPMPDALLCIPIFISPKGEACGWLHRCAAQCVPWSPPLWRHAVIGAGGHPLPREEQCGLLWTVRRNVSAPPPLSFDVRTGERGVAVANHDKHTHKARRLSPPFFFFYSLALARGGGGGAA